MAILAEAGYEVPTLEELGRTGFVDLPGAVRIASSRGLITAVQQGRYYDATVLDRFLAIVREVASERNGDLDGYEMEN